MAEEVDRRRFLEGSIALSTLAVGGCLRFTGQETATPQPSTTDPATDAAQTPTEGTPTATPTPPESETPTATPTPTKTPTPTQTATPTPTRTPTPTESQTTASGDSVTVTGTVEHHDGSAVSAAEMLFLGENFVTVELDSDGSFSASLSPGTDYTAQYAQGTARYPDDEIPDLYTVDRFDTSTKTDLGTITLPKAYELQVTVEDESGDPVANIDRAGILSHINENGVQSGFGVRTDSDGQFTYELRGQLVIDLSHDGASAKQRLTVDSETSITMTLS